MIKRSIVLGPKMNLPTDLFSIMERFANGASSADGVQISRRWPDHRHALNELRRAPWPPERTS